MGRTPEQIIRDEMDEVQRIVNEADRPRLRELELARKNAPDYYGPQPGQPPGKWTVDGTLVRPDEPDSGYLKTLEPFRDTTAPQQDNASISEPRTDKAGET